MERSDVQISTSDSSECAAGTRTICGGNTLRHNGQGAPLNRGRKRGSDFQAIGRSRGGRGTKIQLVTNEAGRALAFVVTPGQMGDMRSAQDLLAALLPPEKLLADAAYDSNALRSFLTERGAERVISNNPARKQLHPLDRAAYRAQNAIERTTTPTEWQRDAAVRRGQRLIAAIAVALQDAMLRALKHSQR